MMRLIDADALSDILEQMIETADIKSREYIGEPVVAHHYETLKKQIEEILTGVSEFPTIEPERKKGKWISNSPVTMKCSQCGYFISDWKWHESNFCPNCGADMREGDSE